MTIGEEDGTTIGTFGVVGVESIVENQITLLPVLWDEYLVDGPPFYTTFFVSGRVIGTEFTGTLFQPDGAVCADDLFRASVQ